MTRLFTTIAAVLTALLLSACGGGVIGPSQPPAPGQAIKSRQPLNTDHALFIAAAPCTVVTADDLSRLFGGGSFSSISDDSPVTDVRDNERACGYDSADARIDHDGSYDVTAVEVMITTSLDNKEGFLWNALVEAAKATGSTVVSDTLIHHGPGWYTARKGMVIIEVNDNNSQMTDAGALRIVRLALSKLP